MSRIIDHVWNAAKHLSFGLMTLWVMTNWATAQLYTADPYDPYGRAYRPFAYPGAGYNPALPNASRFPQGPGGVATANQFQSFLSDPGLDLFGRTGRYDESYRKYDESFGRTATTGELADEKYFAQREKREQAMIRAMVERDPKKRDEMIREAEAEAKKQGSLLGPSVRRGASSLNVPSAPSLRARARSADRVRATPSAPRATSSVRRGATPAAPPIVPTSPGRVSAPVDRSTPSAPVRTPAEVLERNRRVSGERPSPRSPASLPPREEP